MTADGKDEDESYDTSGVKIPKPIALTVAEVGRHVEDRNGLDPFGNPRGLALCVLVERYVEEHSDDFEKERGDQPSWIYRGQTDAEPLDYDSVGAAIEAFTEDDTDDEAESEDDGDSDDEAYENDDGEGDDSDGFETTEDGKLVLRFDGE